MERRDQDRRVRRTRKQLQTALAALMREKDLKDITVRELTELADVNRGTFYAHYKNISEVLESIQSDVARQLGRLFQHLDADSIFYDCESILSASATIFISLPPVMLYPGATPGRAGSRRLSQTPKLFIDFRDIGVLLGFICLS